MAVGAIAVSLAGAPALARELVVCADPHNLPYSSRDASGFENRVVQIVADELHATLRYTWQPFVRGVVRKTLKAQACDVLAGVPVGMDGVATTEPYYRSGYVFVYRRDAPPIDSFDDPRLRTAAVGVQLVGDDMAATPPGLALVRRGIVANVEGFPVFGDGPSAKRMIDAIDSGRLDVALVWGPQAGYFARRARTPLAMSLARGEAGAPLEFSIAMAVRRGDTALRDDLDRALERAQARVRTVLDDFAVPQVADAARADARSAR